MSSPTNIGNAGEHRSILTSIGIRFIGAQLTSIITKISSTMFTYIQFYANEHREVNIGVCRTCGEHSSLSGVGRIRRNRHTLQCVVTRPGFVCTFTACIDRDWCAYVVHILCTRNVFVCGVRTCVARTCQRVYPRC